MYVHPLSRKNSQFENLTFSQMTFREVSSLNRTTPLLVQKEFLDHQVMIIFNIPIFLYAPVHEISNNVVCATSKASDQPAHMRSLIRAFAHRSNIL